MLWLFTLGYEYTLQSVAITSTLGHIPIQFFNFNSHCHLYHKCSYSEQFLSSHSLNLVHIVIVINIPVHILQIGIVQWYIIIKVVP